MRIEQSKSEVTNDWSMDDLEKVLKTLKNGKARDAHGHMYELFKNGGNDLKLSLLKLFNLVKNKQINPNIFCQIWYFSLIIWHILYFDPNFNFVRLTLYFMLGSHD